MIAISRAPMPADRLEQPEQLLGLAAVRQRHHDVVVADRAEIAVDGLGRMQEPGGRAGARERRRDLPADDARLAHAGDDDAAPAVEEQLDGALEVAVDAIDEAEDRGRFGAEDLSARGPVPVVGVGASWSSRHAMALADDRVDPHESIEERLEQRSSRSAFCASLFACAGSSWTSMNTPSTPAATPADGHRLDELRLPGRDAVAGARQLQAVRHVVDDGVAERAQDRKRAHVDDEVVVAERERRAR